MIYIRDEGEEIRDGLNIYPRKSDHFGYVFQIFNCRLWMRHNKSLKSIFIGGELLGIGLNIYPIEPTYLGVVLNMFNHRLYIGYDKILKVFYSGIKEEGK